jgi:hypothetical protein
MSAMPCYPSAGNPYAPPQGQGYSLPPAYSRLDNRYLPSAPPGLDYRSLYPPPGPRCYYPARPYPGLGYPLPAPQYQPDGEDD